MIIELSIIFFIIGIGLGTMDLFVVMPPELAPMVFMNRMLGAVFIGVGLVFLLSRGFSTGAFLLMDLPKPGKVLLFHQRRGKNPNTKIISGKLKDLEYIKTKGKVFKDTGNGFRLSGHDCRRTHEMIAFDIPDWLGEWFNQVKRKYLVENRTDLYELYEGFQSLSPCDTEAEAVAQLEEIESLRPLLNNPEKKKWLLGQDLDTLQHLSETLWDGRVVRMEDVEEFIESATPNELDALVKQEYLNDVMRDRNYSDPGEINWGRWLPLFGFFVICCALAAILLQSTFGG